MKYLKLAFISVIVFCFVITLISFFFPSKVRISKALDINVTKDSLLAVLGEPKRWRSWYPGADSFQLVSVMNRTLGYRMNSEGALLRVMEENDSGVVLEASGAGIRDMKSGWNIYPSSSPHMQTVQWYMDFNLRWYPWEKFSSITFEKRFGPLMEQGLEKLRKYLEQ